MKIEAERVAREVITRIESMGDLSMETCALTWDCQVQERSEAEIDAERTEMVIGIIHDLYGDSYGENFLELVVRRVIEDLEQRDDPVVLDEEVYTRSQIPIAMAWSVLYYYYLEWIRSIWNITTIAVALIASISVIIMSFYISILLIWGHYHSEGVCYAPDAGVKDSGNEYPLVVQNPEDYNHQEVEIEAYNSQIVLDNMSITDRAIILNIAYRQRQIGWDWRKIVPQNQFRPAEVKKYMIELGSLGGPVNMFEIGIKRKDSLNLELY